MSSNGATEDQDGIRIGYYEDWMFDQVIDMVIDQYELPRDYESSRFKAYYDAPFQRENGIRLVAVDGETVCGFQSYSYWPYVYQGQHMRSFQSGNSLVSRDYRGRKIFARLLNHLVKTDDRPDIDFLMGFPVEMSYGSFIRNEWTNPLDLSWYVRPIRPFSILSSKEPRLSDWNFEASPEHVDASYPEGQFALSKSADFLEWRAGYYDDRGMRFYMHHREGGKTIRFALKPNRRGRVNELVVGGIVRDSEDPTLLKSGLRALVRAARGHSFVTMLSIALNAESSDPSIRRAFRGHGFFKIKPKIHFIVKPLRQIDRQIGGQIDGPLDGLLDAQRWQLFRSDIDTW